MNDEIIIVSASPDSNPTKPQEYKVLSHQFRDDAHSSSYRIDEVLKIVSDLKPEMITIFAADMHGRTIVSFIEYFLSKKFKSVLYEFSSSSRGKFFSRIIIIKMQRYV